MSLPFLVDGDEHLIETDAVMIAGFTGRDRAAVREHLDELRELGVPTPATTPTYYPAPASLVVQTATLTVTEANTSGEAEVVVIVNDGRTWITLGSDHTDRVAETIDIARSKIVCQKPIARNAWPLENVAAHIDQLELRSWITDDAAEVLYQEGTLADFMPLHEIVAGAPFAIQPDRVMVFTGTLPALGGIRPASTFRAALTDPVADNTITLEYRIDVQQTSGDSQ